MVTIPAGTFLMGDPIDKVALPHTVFVDEFQVEEWAVTGLMWSDVADYAQQHFGFKFTSGRAKESTHPVQYVTWLDAARFCNYRSFMDSLKPAYDLTNPKSVVWYPGDGWRLPTEAEWEKALRGNVTQRFPWGQNITGQDCNYKARVAWPYDKGPYNVQTNGYQPRWVQGAKPYTSPVDAYPFLPSKIWGMGNVNEWCWDWYAAGYYKVSPADNPSGPSTGTKRVIRGGSWADEAPVCRVANRGSQSPSTPLNSVGFRCVRSVI